MCVMPVPLTWAILYLVNQVQLSMARPLHTKPESIVSCETMPNVPRMENFPSNCQLFWNKAARSPFSRSSVEPPHSWCLCDGPVLCFANSVCRQIRRGSCHLGCTGGGRNKSSHFHLPSPHPVLPNQCKIASNAPDSICIVGKVECSKGLLNIWLVQLSCTLNQPIGT